jgi:hypothetical protein
VQQLLEACLLAEAPGDADTGAAGAARSLLAALLRGVAAHAPGRLAAAAAAGRGSGGGPAGEFVAAQAAAAEAAELASALCGLYPLGRRLATAALLRPQAAAAAGAAGGGGGPTAALEAVAALLAAGCREGGDGGDLLAASLCACVGAGLVDGQLAAAAALRGSGGLSASGSGAAPLGLPPSHPLAAPAVALFSGLARVCSRCAEAADGGVPGAAAGATFAPPPRGGGGGGAVAVVAAAAAGHAYATLLRTHAAVVPAQPTLSGLLCALGAVLDCGLSPAALYLEALGHRPAGGSGDGGGDDGGGDGGGGGAAAAPPAAPPLLEQEVGPLARWAADWAARLPADARLRVGRRLRGAAAGAARGYSCYLAAAPPAALAGRHAAAVKNVFDRTFAVHLAAGRALWPPPPLAAAAPAAPGAAPPAPGGRGSPADAALRGALAAQLLAAFARLQFCRLQLPQYSEAVSSLVGEVAANGAAAERMLRYAERLRAELAAPSYPWPAAAAADGGGSGGAASAELMLAGGAEVRVCAPAPAWQRDGVAAASLVFLLPLLPVALRAAPRPEAAADAALPLVLSCLGHPMPPAALAAHSAFASIASVCEARGCRGVVERAAPAYVRLGAGALPAGGSFEGLRLGLAFLWRALPPGGGVGLLLLQRLCEHAGELAWEAAAEGAAPQQKAAAAGGGGGGGGGAGGGTAGGGGGGSSSDSSATAATAAAQVFALVVQSLLEMDYQQLPAALALVDALLAAAPPPVRRAWLGDAQAALLASHNVALKHELVAWLQRAAAAAAAAEGAAGGMRSKL